MQTRALATLVATRTHGGFAAAAAARNMTVSAVSMQIKALETELGVTLFDRSHRPPRLTPVGRMVCDKAAEIVDLTEDLTALAPQDGLVGHYRIGFVPTASIRLLPDFLIETEQHAPDAWFDIETDLSATLEARVRSGMLDAAVVTGAHTPAEDLVHVTLREEPLVYVAPKPLAKASPDDLFHEKRFFHFMPESGIGTLIAAEVAGRTRQLTMLDSVEAILECVARGLGFTLLPEPDVARAADPRLAILKNTAPPLTRTLALVTRSAPLASNLASLFSPGDG